MKTLDEIYDGISIEVKEVGYDERMFKYEVTVNYGRRSKVFNYSAGTAHVFIGENTWDQYLWANRDKAEVSNKNIPYLTIEQVLSGKYFSWLVTGKLKTRKLKLDKYGLLACLLEDYTMAMNYSAGEMAKEFGMTDYDEVTDMYAALQDNMSKMNHLFGTDLLVLLEGETE